MNILLVSDTYKPHINGLVTAMDMQFNSLCKQKHNVTLLVPELKKYNNKNIITSPGLPFPFLPEYKMTSMFSFKNLYKIKKLNIDIIHSHTPFSLGIYAIMISKILKIPIIHTYHTYFEEYSHYIKIPKKTGKYTVKVFSKWYSNNMDHVIVPSSFMRSVLSKYKIRTTISIIPNGYDLNYFKKKVKTFKWHKKLKIPLNSKILLFVGRIAKEKNVYFLIDTFKKLCDNYNNLYLVFTGDGPEKNKLIKYISKLNLSLKVKFTGFVKHKDINQIYAIGDIFIFPSKTETQGLVLIEAMLNNMPVVAFYKCGTTSVLPNKKILGISPIRSNNNFLKEIEFYLNNNYDKKKLQTNLKNYVKLFDESKTTIDLINLYKKVITKYKK